MILYPEGKVKTKTSFYITSWMKKKYCTLLQRIVEKNKTFGTTNFKSVFVDNCVTNNISVRTMRHITLELIIFVKYEF